MKRIDENRLFRKPFSEMEHQLYWGEPKYLDSPDNRHYLAFSHFAEPKMGVTICLFNLINSDSDIIQRFEPLVALGNGYQTRWSNNSIYFSIPLITIDDNYFIYNLNKLEFAIVPVENAWILKSNLTDTYFELEYDESEIPDLKEEKEYPTKNYLKPENIQIPLNELNWHKLQCISDFEKLYKNEKLVQLRPIDKGFRDFKGEFPASNDRTVWDIERFAEYGDVQSQEWLNEIKQKTSNDFYRWENASKYIGLKNRKK